MMHDVLQPHGAAGERAGDRVADPLGEDLPRAARLRASEPAYRQPDPHATAVRRQIGEAALVSAVDPRRQAAARRTPCRRPVRPRDSDNLGIIDPHPLDAQPWRQQ